MRNVNLTARLYTNESYQQYFRRRIANILSRYCEHQANECPETSVALRKQRKEEQQRRLEQKINDSSKSTILFEDDEDEPAFTKENVVILKVIIDENNRTHVYFVVTKVANAGSINNQVIMEPNKIKYIMSAQIAPLSRVLGGIRIEQLRVVNMQKGRLPYSNKSLIIVVSIVGLSFTTCCLIALIKLLR